MKSLTALAHQKTVFSLLAYSSVQNKQVIPSSYVNTVFILCHVKELT